MLNPFSRTEMLLGASAMEQLKNAHVAVFGVGGVGGYVIEALARSGVGALDLTDNDTVSLTNLNRQIIALHSTVGRYKTEVMAERIHDINPGCRVTVHNVFYLPETERLFDFSQYDYVVDAIDTVSGKLAIALNAQKAGVPVISSMGTGNKLHPELLEIADIHKTSVCPLARVMRLECRKRGIKKLKVVYSRELPRKPSKSAEEAPGSRRSVPGSTAFVPPVAGLLIASEVVRDLTQ